MKRWLMVWLSVGLSGFVEAQDARLLASGEFSVNGVKYSVELRTSDLVDAPDWVAGKEEPTITPNQAYLVAKAKLDEMFPKLRDAQLYAVNLSRVLDEKGQRHGLYHIFFTSPDIETSRLGSLIVAGGISFYLPLNRKLIAPHVREKKGPEPLSRGDGKPTPEP